MLLLLYRQVYLPQRCFFLSHIQSSCVVFVTARTRSIFNTTCYPLSPVNLSEDFMYLNKIKMMSAMVMKAYVYLASYVDQFQMERFLPYCNVFMKMMLSAINFVDIECGISFSVRDTHSRTVTTTLSIHCGVVIFYSVPMTLLLELRFYFEAWSINFTSRNEKNTQPRACPAR